MSGGLHAAQSGLHYFKPKYGDGPTKRVRGTVDCDGKSYKSAGFYDECGRRIHPVGWCFFFHKRVGAHTFEGCLNAVFQSPNSPSADQPYYECCVLPATVMFLGHSARYVTASWEWYKERDQSISSSRMVTPLWIDPAVDRQRVAGLLSGRTRELLES
ncbi:MAG TPA: hypothetical protein VM510_09040 [Caulifigura sp.]|nr:hypothetical protein [Caulifigura sp.]